VFQPRFSRLRQSIAKRNFSHRDLAADNQDLLLAVLLDMDLHRLFGVASRMNCMAVRGVGMVSRRFVVSSLVMLGGFPVMTGSMREVLRSFFVVFRSLLRHEILLRG
jgi:hypothetical protein